MRIALLLMTATLSFSVFSQDARYDKNGLPCVAEICLGDGLAEISKVSWDRSKNPFSSPNKPLYTSSRKLLEEEKETATSRFKGDIEGALPFLVDGRFDAVALPALARVTAACERHQLTGTYTTDSGLPTKVLISLIPNQSDTSTQRWTVVSIIRSFPTAVTNQQKTELQKKLDERYKAFKTVRLPKPGEGRYSKNLSLQFGFHLSMDRGYKEGDRMKMHPSCGGTNKVLID